MRAAALAAGQSRCRAARLEHVGHQPDLGLLALHDAPHGRRSISNQRIDRLLRDHNIIPETATTHQTVRFRVLSVTSRRVARDFRGIPTPGFP
ncbi:hypothetical protein [Streptomyces sp. ME18-1-4]|uniref:hypothetical protein n=1 Tax=Streptomyces sp. ME18-1-4 TaxID=3028685 RepID=UPI0029B27030|nr:hypothetical protein [Streptomyces sp. ME18-1-4]MDX3241566.1 hypothetical protein [Streptomyces sp. ME18-1-4]